MNMTLNQLPSRTWNWLKMNETKINLEESFESVLPVSLEGKFIVDSNYDIDIETGVGNDVTALTEKAERAIVTFDKNTEEKPTVLKYEYEDGDNKISRLNIKLEAESKGTVIVLLTSPINAKGTAALQIKVEAGAGSKLNLCTVQLLGTEFICINDIGAVCEDTADVKIVRLELGSKKAYAGAAINLAGKESTFTADIGYHVYSGQTIDMNYNAIHRGKKTESLMLASGILEEKSKKIFRGTIDLKKGSSGAKGTESENVLLIGDKMINQSIPLILCKEEDVEGNHGASIGQLDKKILFYLGSKGINEEEARRIVAQSRIDAVCSKIPNEEIREKVAQFEEERRKYYAENGN